MSIDPIVGPLLSCLSALKDLERAGEPEARAGEHELFGDIFGVSKGDASMLGPDREVRKCPPLLLEVAAGEWPRRFEDEVPI